MMIERITVDAIDVSVTIAIPSLRSLQRPFVHPSRTISTLGGFAKGRFLVLHLKHHLRIKSKTALNRD